MEFFANGSLIGSSTTPPYTFAWANAPPGVYTITAKVTDNFGQTSVSPPAQVQIFTTDTTYFHHDFLGNVIAASDGLGQVVYAESYLPFGARQVNDPASQVAQQNRNRPWFHGKAQDESTGLQYFGARYYDPAIGRFTGVDAVGFNESNLHSFNRYGYGNNNPYRYTDPDGKSAVLLLLDAVFIGTALIVASDPKLAIQIGKKLWGAFHNLFPPGCPVAAQASDSGVGRLLPEPERRRIYLPLRKMQRPLKPC